jgi:NAD(P)-dependent dehydrogenase (short-subunit alcohol dehydrogenase family)
MRRVLITGASGETGDGVIQAFRDAGWRVAGTARSAPAGGGRDGVAWVTADLTDATAAARAAADAVDQLEGLDALVCLVGGFRLTPVDSSGWEDFAALLDLSYRPTVIAVLAALPHLSEGAAIVTIGAKAAQAPGPRSSGYAAAKSAVIAFSASLAAELRPRAIRVNCVLPGTLDTPTNREAMPNAKAVNWVPPRRLGELIRYLADPESEPLTGAAIPIG